MKNIKWGLLVSFLGFLQACTPVEEVGPQNLSGNWNINWVNDFAVSYGQDVRNLGQLCAPGGEVKFEIAGSASTKFDGNRNGTANSYLIFGDKGNNNAPPANLQHVNHLVSCDDIVVASIQHKDIYITGIDGYIFKKKYEDGSCGIYSASFPVKERNNFTVFIKLSGSQSKTETKTIKLNDGTTKNETTTVYDTDNRVAGITYDCEYNKVKSIFSAHVNSANAKSGVENNTLTSKEIEALNKKFKFR